jgi:hypothetical protein
MKVCAGHDERNTESRRRLLATLFAVTDVKLERLLDALIPHIATLASTRSHIGVLIPLPEDSQAPHRVMT